MIGRVPRYVLLVGIVTGATSCDNVSWGGFELTLQEPSGDTAAAPAAPVEEVGGEAAEAILPPTLAMGPLLYAGARRGDSAWVVPVGELGDGTLNPLPQGAEGDEFVRQLLATRLRPGQELTLFSEGSRVGTLVVGGGSRESGYCGPRPRAHGHLELTPGAAAASAFLALEKPLGREFRVAPYRPLRDQYDQRVASLNLASASVPQVGAPWPPSFLEIRQDLRVFRFREGRAPAITATFLYRDQLQVGQAPDDAYSLLVLGEPVGGPDPAEFALLYAWYRPVGEEGKGAPRFYSHLDWDGDGDAEVLLEVLGAESRWWAALDRGPDGWVLDFQSACGTPGGDGE